MHEWLLPVLVTAVISVTGSFFAFSRTALTKKDHEEICATKSNIVSIQLTSLAKSVDEVKRDVKSINAYLLEGKGGK